jgi:hypothetical protein
MPQARSSRSDRELQDEVITYLADATLRRSSADLPMAPEQAQRADRFARFLARRYYRDRLARSFRRETVTDSVRVNRPSQVMCER